MNNNRVPSPAGSLDPVPRVHIVGRKNAGKTTLVCELVRLLSQQGLSVATIKHTHHRHELDTPGKDSHQHRESGAAGVGILSPGMTAAFVPVPRSDNEWERYGWFDVMFQNCDLILVEGDLSTTAIKVEVWRAAVSEPPYAATDDSITAVVTDDPVTCECPQWKRSEMEALAIQILKLVEEQCGR